jgi:hypothetical protein
MECWGFNMIIKNKVKCCKLAIVIASAIFTTGCATKQMVIEIGDNDMSCEHLLAEISESDKGRKSENKKAVVGTVGTVGGATAAGVAATTVASIALLPLALVAGAGYAGSKMREAHQKRKRVEHLTNIYNNKGCASSITSTDDQIDQDENIGNEVKLNEMMKVQTALSERGFDLGTVDGIYGKKTQSALISFQEGNGLTATGLADEATKELLLK